MFAKVRGALGGGGKDAGPGDEGYSWACLGGRKHLTQVIPPGHALTRLHPRSTQPKPFRVSPSRAATAVSPTVHQLCPLPSMGGGEGPGAGLVPPDRVEVLLSDAESFGGEGGTLPLYCPLRPR